VFGDWADTATERLSSLPEPFAAYVHLWELHEDVHVPDAYDDPEYGETPYARALSALDPKLEALADAVPDDTVVAVTGDHGESVTHRHNPLRLLAKVARDAVKYYGGVDTRGVVSRLNRALADRGPDVADHFIENGHGENVFDFTTNVPFVVAGPGVEAATVDAQVRQVDVTPTLLDLLGLVDAVDADGAPIRPEAGIEDRPAYMRACGASLHRERNWARAIRAEGGKYVVHPDRDWAPRVYDLEADPAELAPADDPELERRLERLLPESGPPATEAERLDIDDHLKSLGYR
jgi:arylsulfatase A-like enzyme